MTSQALSCQQIRDIDRRAIDEFGMSGLVLMENAGRGCADMLARLDCDGLVAICCGKGHNGGDGFVLARHMDLRGKRVKVLLLCDPAELRADAAANYAILVRSEVPIVVFGNTLDVELFDRELAGAEWIIDALLGTGSSGTPRPPLDAAIERMNAAKGRKLAIDIPSGLNCDTGEPSAVTFRANHTCTLVAPKIGFTNPNSKPFVGQMHVIDVGVPRKLLAELRATV